MSANLAYSQKSHIC